MPFNPSEVDNPSALSHCVRGAGRDIVVFPTNWPTPVNRSPVSMETLFVDPVRRAARVRRFAGDLILKDETLDAHRGWILLYSFVLAEALLEDGEMLDYGRLFRYVALHDMEEVVTADVHMRVKRRAPEAYAAFMDAQRGVIEDLAASLGSRDYADMMEPHGDIESQIVWTADLLCVAAKFIDELMVGNISVLHYLPLLDKDFASAIKKGNLVLARFAKGVVEGFNNALQGAQTVVDGYSGSCPWGTETLDASVNVEQC